MRTPIRAHVRNSDAFSDVLTKQVMTDHHRSNKDPLHMSMNCSIFLGITNYSSDHGMSDGMILSLDELLIGSCLYYDRRSRMSLVSTIGLTKASSYLVQWWPHDISIIASCRQNAANHVLNISLVGGRVSHCRCRCLWVTV